MCGWLAYTASSFEEAIMFLCSSTPFLIPGNNRLDSKENALISYTHHAAVTRTTDTVQYNDAPKVSEQRATTNAYFLVNLNLRQNTIILQAP